IMDGKGTRGVLQGDGVLNLEARDPTTTIVLYSGQAQLGGALSAVGTQVAGAAGTVMLKSFFARLADQLSTGEVAPAAVPPLDATASAFTPEAVSAAAAPPTQGSAAPSTAAPSTAAPSPAPLPATTQPTPPQAPPTVSAPPAPLAAGGATSPEAGLALATTERRFTGRTVGILAAAGVVVLVVVVALILQAVPH